MKRIIILLLAVILTTVPMNVQAESKPSDELRQGGQVIAFDPVITSFERQRSSMVINLDTVECVYMFEVQWSDKPDFEGAETRYFRNVDNRGCLIIAYEPIRQNGKTYNTRTIWYGGRKMSFRKVLRKHPKDRLVTTQGIVNELRNRLRIKKRLYVPGKGRYVRVRCIYYGARPYAYSKWIEAR